MDEATKLRMAPAVLATASQFAARMMDLRAGGEVLSPSSVSREWTKQELRTSARLAWQLAQYVVDEAPSDPNI